MQANHYYPFGMPFAEGNATSSQPYKYNGKELDTERGLNLYDYGARLYDPALARWTTQDPKAEKYPNVSPYVYVSDNPIIFLDPNGREKIQALEKNNENRPLIRAADNFDDDKKVINIWAHGNSKGMYAYYYDSHTSRNITDTEDFISFLTKNSKVWRERKKGEEVTIVLHSCDTGSETDEEDPSFAHMLSKNMKNVKIIAPTKKVLVNNASGKEEVADEGKWIEYENGKPINTYDSKSEPGSIDFSQNNAAFWIRIWNRISN